MTSRGPFTDVFTPIRAQITAWIGREIGLHFGAGALILNSNKRLKSMPD
jgi:hypothetical protein